MWFVEWNNLLFQSFRLFHFSKFNFQLSYKNNFFRYIKFFIQPRSGSMLGAQTTEVLKCLLNFNPEQLRQAAESSALDQGAVGKPPAP